MDYLEWAALIVGAVLIFTGIRAISIREANVPEKYEGKKAVLLGWIWIVLGALFVLSVVFDVKALKTLFRLFLEAAN